MVRVILVVSVALAVGCTAEPPVGIATSAEACINCDPGGDDEGDWIALSTTDSLAQPAADAVDDSETAPTDRWHWLPAECLGRTSPTSGTTTVSCCGWISHDGWREVYKIGCCEFVIIPGVGTSAPDCYSPTNWLPPAGW